MIPFLFFYTEEQKLMVNHGQIDDYSTFITFSIFAFIISAISYAVASYRLLYQYENLSKNNFAYTESIDLSWLKIFILGMGMTFLTAIVFIILETGLGIHFSFNTDVVFYLLIIIFIFYLGYSGIRHKSIFADQINQNLHIVEPKSAGEYNRSGLKDDDAIRYHVMLIELMKTSKPYLEPKLTLSNLADEMDISINHLSQVINQYEEKNFFDFVNSYRVHEFKVRALDPANSNFSILAIALDSGFNSKSSFNQVFKKFTGQTPSQYMSEAKCVKM
jgi:AraC-like DNA-binding protein